MPRYLIERNLPDGLALVPNEQGRNAVTGIISNNTLNGVTWLHSYVAHDKKRSFCIYDAPSPEAIRKVADRNGLPIERIVEVRVLDPYFYL